MHYKVYDNKIECKNKKEFIVSNKQNIKIYSNQKANSMLIPLDAISFITHKKQTTHLLISEIISEEFVSNDLKLVYAVIKGFDHYVSFYTSSNVSLKYHCKMYANIDLNKIKLEV